jgi:hypothetical protein
MKHEQFTAVDVNFRPGPAQPTMVRPALMKLVLVPVVQPESRSIPSEVGTTDPAYSVAPATRKEHPQPMTLTDDATAASEPVCDPTHPLASLPSL